MPAQLGKSLAGMKRLLLGNTDFPPVMPLALRGKSVNGSSLAIAAACWWPADIRDFPSGENCFVAFQ